MSETRRRWMYLSILSVIWGSSYILIKKALLGFDPLQLGSVRIVMAAAMLAIIGFKSIRTIGRGQWKWVALSGVVGSLLPMYFFAYAETEIDSAVAAVLNSLVPLFTLFVGYFAFNISFSRNQLIGVLVGLAGAVLLIGFGSLVYPGRNYWYAGFVVLASLGYACNANIIKSKLSGVSPMGIAVGNFMCILLPALALTVYSGALSDPVRTGPEFWPSVGYLFLLCAFGTCIAKVLFNHLIHISSPVFSVSVTYLIPVVGIIWGVADGETFGLKQLGSAALILLGVYLVNKRKAPVKPMSEDREKQLQSKSDSRTS